MTWFLDGREGGFFLLRPGTGERRKLTLEGGDDKFLGIARGIGIGAFPVGWLTSISRDD